MAIVEGEKNLVHERELCVITMQRYKKFNGKIALQFCEGDANLRKFVPEDWFKTKRFNRLYLWNIISTMGGDYCTKITNHAINLRQKA